ncbi:hypothetical protein T439DRAFT_94641 [Meredithblackwellia eburnea MCA 4105]
MWGGRARSLMSTSFWCRCEAKREVWAAPCFEEGVHQTPKINNAKTIKPTTKKIHQGNTFPFSPLPAAPVGVATTRSLKQTPNPSTTSQSTTTHFPPLNLSPVGQLRH